MALRNISMDMSPNILRDIFRNIRTTIILLSVLFVTFLLSAQAQTTYIPPDPDPAKIDAAHFQVGYEDSHMRVLHMVLAPGEVTPMFEQLEHVVAVVRPSRLILTDAGGNLRQLEMTTGQAVHG